MTRLLILFVFIFSLSVVGMSQVVGGYFDKLAEMYENEEWEDCIDRADKLLGKKKYAGDPELYLYQALAYYQISRDSTLAKLTEYKGAYMDALKNLNRAVKKDKYGEYFPENNFIIEDIIKAGIPMILNYSADNDYSKINSLLRNFMSLSEDPGLVFYNGVMDFFNYNEREALETMDKMLPAFDSVKNYAADYTQPLLPDGMKHYFDLLVKEYELDSAEHIIKIAHDHFPGDTAIERRYQMNLDSLRYD
ncbi:MAG: hypothetical protein PF590_11045 [Candidatus Delongbacteria bacterium]|jgi:hypothetical protein|nr:hypothetical protein [Candidatus Delongbacteria bacterium]